MHPVMVWAPFLSLFLSFFLGFPVASVGSFGLLVVPLAPLGPSLVSFGSPLALLLVSFGFLWFSLGSFWLPFGFLFGSFLSPLSFSASCSLWLPLALVGSLLLPVAPLGPLWFPLAPFGSRFGSLSFGFYPAAGSRRCCRQLLDATFSARAYTED